jgi:hypothetical protein
MDGSKTQEALNGIKTIKLNGTEYQIKLAMDDIANYIKYLKKQALSIQFCSDEKDKNGMLKIAEEIDDYKLKFAQKILTQGGLDSKAANELVLRAAHSFMSKNVLDEWLGFVDKDSEKKDARVKEIKN